jgi:hypothetical protein
METMIQFDKDGVTLIGYDAAGNKFTHNFLEGSLYDDMLTVRKAQIAAAGENGQNAANYTTVLAGIQTSETAGRPHDTPPIKPQQKVIDDLGNISFAPFVPPLPDFVPLKTAPSGPIKVDVPDKQAIMYNMILALFRKAFPDA